MTDAKYIFHQDVAEKKSVAAQLYRTNRRGHGALRFPSDNLTKKEIKKMNGPIREYNLDQPMTWREFTSMPLDLQKEYITKLHEKFPFMQHSRELVQMFGVGESAICKYLRGTLHMPKFRTGSKSIDSLQREAWNIFLEGNVPTPAEEPAEEPVLFQDEPENVPEPAPEPPKEPVLYQQVVPSARTVMRGHVELTGDAESIVNYLRMVLMDNDCITLRVDWESEDAEQNY